MSLPPQSPSGIAKSKAELLKMQGEGQLGPQRADKVGRKTLVLDLDETLVHSQFKQPAKFDLKLPV